MCKVMVEMMGNTTIRVYMKQSQSEFDCVNVYGLIMKPKDGEQIGLFHIWILYNILSTSTHVY
jgi:hypothetical protein